MPISWDFPLWVSTPRLWATCLPWGWAANAGGYKGCLLPSAPVTLWGQLHQGWSICPTLGPGQWGERAGGHLLGITWRWDSVGAGDEGQLASAAWSRPGWQGSPRLWGSE